MRLQAWKDGEPVRSLRWLEIALAKKPTGKEDFNFARDAGSWRDYPRGGRARAYREAMERGSTSGVIVRLFYPRTVFARRHSPIRKDNFRNEIRLSLESYLHAIK